MERDIFAKISDWDNDARRKPLILMGARQVGKSWLMEEFARRQYANDHVIVNLMDNERLRNGIEAGNLDPKAILSLIELETDKTITPGKTLLIMDEIQESPRALTSLKFFQERLPELAIMAAGSLLGLALRKGKSDNRPNASFPVGKVDFLDVRPMTFGEFLMATGEERRLAKIQKADWDILALQHDELTRLLKIYYFTGGMPEAVLEYTTSKNFQRVRKVQKAILRAYDEDFAKHASPSLLAKIRLLWNNIPAQLAKENKKFIYSALRDGARAREYEEALQWLDDAAMVSILRRASSPRMPLKANEDFSAFKLFMHDVGLLAAMSDLPPQTILEGSTIFTNFKGALTEQYVMQELVGCGISPCYWSSERGDAEVDFLIQGAKSVLPVEAKAERNLNAKSLRVFHDLFAPSASYRTSLAKRHVGRDVHDIPLYAIPQIAKDASTR